MRPSRSALAIITLTALPVLAACSASVSIGDDPFDKSAFEKKAIAEIDSDYAHLNRTVSSYTCDYPEEHVKDGSTFTCVADVDGAKVRTAIEITDDDGSFRLSTDDRLYDMPTVARAFVQPVADKLGGRINLNCGTGVKALAAGSSFECQVTDENTGEVRKFVYTVGENSADDSWSVA